LDALGVRLYAGKDTRTIILEALDEHPETREALALLTGTSVQNVGKHLATLVAQGLAARVQGGWIRR
jgi:predicted ArsR family transcriptional regulator